MRINWQDARIISVSIVLALIFLGIFSGRIITGVSYNLILAVILGSAIFITALVNTDAGLAVLIFSMLLSPEIMVGQVPGRDIVIRFDDVLLALITFTWFAKTAINKGVALFIKTPLNKAIGFYILVCVISTMRGAVLGYLTPAKGFFYIIRYAEYFLLYILVVNHIHSRKQIKFFLTIIFVTCALVSIYGIIQIPSGKRVSAPFEGEVGEPNTFGGYLLFILCIAVGILLQNVPRKLKQTMIGLSILIFIPFLFTLSRASYFAIIVSFLAFIILSKRKIVLAGVASAIILAGVALQPEAVFSRVKYTFQKERRARVKVGSIYLDPSSSARIRSWQDAIETWEKNPILGRGITGFGFLDGQYFRTLPELGVVGLFALLWLLWIIFKNSLDIHKKMKDELYKGITLGFLAGFVGLTFHALTANTFILIRIMEPFWFMTGIVMMLPELKKYDEEEIEPTQP
jgi:O-antigen ligase